MEEFIPILLGLIYFGYKYYSKTQKEKSQKPASPNDAPQNMTQASPSLNDFIKQFYEEDTTPYTEPALASFSTKESSDSSWQDEVIEEVVEKKPESIEYRNVQSNRKHTKTQFETIQNKPNQNTESLDFDLRKAIVYDAIMNPPYL